MFKPRLFRLKPDDASMLQAGPSPACACLDAQYGDGVFPELILHQDVQDTNGEAWRLLLELIARAIDSKASEFAPGLVMPPELWNQIVTLPPYIKFLTSVKRLYLYSSHLVRIPPEIGGMRNLKELDLYTSYRLHWLPYEVTRCARLKLSRISTRALYGNYKYRPPFPKLDTNASLELAKTSRCSVCDRDFAAASVRQAWISRLVGKDVVPLLVNSCSEDCIARLPPPAKGYVDHPHTGGLSVRQPEPGFVR